MTFVRFYDQVNIVAYDGKKCCEEVESNKKITKYLIDSNLFSKLPRSLFLLYAPFKVLFQVCVVLTFALDFPTLLSPSLQNTETRFLPRSEST